MMACATLAFWCIEIDPGGAPMTGARMSPTVRPISHQPSDQARTPRVIQLSANACTLVHGAAGHRAERVAHQVGAGVDDGKFRPPAVANGSLMTVGGGGGGGGGGGEVSE